MLSPDVEYVKPKSLDETFKYLGIEGSCILAGGTDIVVNLRTGKVAPKMIVDIKGIKELKGIKETGEGVWIGAATTIDDVVHSPFLSAYRALIEGSGVLGCLEIRYRATIGGNICNASPSADSIPGLILYNAETIIASEHGERRIKLEEFLKGPGKVNLASGEILKGVILPPPPANSDSRYYRRTRTHGMDLSSVSVAVMAEDLDNPDTTEIRIALGAVLPTVTRMKEAEEFLKMNRPIDEVKLNEALNIIDDEVSPRKNSLRATPEYKKEMIKVLVKKAIRDMGGVINK